jgi:translocation and assembly module TamB
MMFIKRRLLFFALCSLLLLIILAVAVAALFRSEAFSRYVVAQAVQRTAPHLKFGQCRGNLLTRLQLNSIEVRHRGRTLTIEAVDIVWNPFALLKGDLHLRHLDVRHVEGRPTTADQTVDSGEQRSEKLALPPIDVRIDNATINELNWVAEGRSHRLRELRAGLSMAGSQLKLHHAEVDLEGIRINGQGQAELMAPFPFHTEWRWQAQQPEKRLYRGRLKVDGNAAKFSLVHDLFTPLVATMRGEITLAPMAPDGYRLGFTGSLDGQHLPPMTIQATGHGRRGQWRIEPLTIESMGGTIVANGDFHPSAIPQWDLTVSGTGIDPGRRWRLWPGDLDVNARLQGAIDNSRLMLKAGRLDVTGRLLERPFSATGRIGITQETVAVDGLRIVSGANRLTLDGTLSDRSALRAEFELQDPYSLWTGFRGNVKGGAMIEGNYRQPAMTLSATGSNVRYGDYVAPTVAATIDLDVGNTAQSKGVIQVHDFRVADHHFADVNIGWRGDFNDHQVRLNASSPSTDVALGFVGNCAKDECKINVDTATFTHSRFGQWQLNHSTSLVVQPESIQAFNACWRQDQDNLCLTSAWDEKGGWVKSGDTDAPPLISMEKMLRDIFNKKHLGWDKSGKS